MRGSGSYKNASFFSWNALFHTCGYCWKLIKIASVHHSTWERESVQVYTSVNVLGDFQSTNPVFAFHYFLSTQQFGLVLGWATQKRYCSFTVDMWMHLTGINTRWCVCSTKLCASLESVTCILVKGDFLLEQESSICISDFNSQKALMAVLITRAIFITKKSSNISKVLRVLC